MLSNKLALVTGASSGIGLAVAKLFAAEGATVILVDIQSNLDHVLNELEQNPKNRQHSQFQCDVSNSQQVEKLFSDIKAKYPEEKVPNVIVNSAGIYIPTPILEANEDDYQRVMDVNLKGSFLITQAAAKELVNKFQPDKLSTYDTYASIINISSIASKPGSSIGFAYSASKSAVISLTRASAKELGKYKIRVNSVLPGWINTPMTSFAAQVIKATEPLTPLGRAGEPFEVAQLVLFLASDKSSYITSAEMQCTGGLFS